MSTHTTENLAAVRARIAALRGSPDARVRVNVTMRKLVLAGADCWLCSGVAKQVQHLIPERAGGLTRYENLIGSCASCSAARLDQDVLEFVESNGKALTIEQGKQRMNALATAAMNRLVPRKARATREVCRSYLEEKRWQHPRVPLAVIPVGDTVFVSPLQVRAGSYAGALVTAMKQAGGDDLGDGLIAVPGNTWTDLVWSLIERHAILVVDRTPQKEGDQWRDDWHVLLPSVDDVRRGAVRKGTLHSPPP